MAGGVLHVSQLQMSDISPVKSFCLNLWVVVAYFSGNTITSHVFLNHDRSVQCY
ncbi:hypothetical protein J6590_001716, partial [Homalodisca vitripennis]